MLIGLKYFKSRYINTLIGIDSINRSNIIGKSVNFFVFNL